MDTGSSAQMMDLKAKGAKRYVRALSGSLIEFGASVTKIDADPEDVGIEIGIDRRAAMTRVTVCRAEIGVQIFELGRHIPNGVGVFDDCASRPAHLMVRLGSAGRGGNSDTTHGDAARDVGHPAIHCVAKPPADCRQVIIANFAARARCSGACGVFHPAISEVALDPVDQRTGLNIVADRRAAKETVGAYVVRSARSGKCRAAPTIPGIKAHIEAAPAEGGGKSLPVDWRCLTKELRLRNVGGIRRGRDK